MKRASLLGRDFLTSKWLFSLRLGLTFQACQSDDRNPAAAVRIILPILLMVLISLFTRPVEKRSLDRFYSKMQTPVQPDPEKDILELEKSYSDPARFEDQKIFPGTNFEFTKWNKVDIIGFSLGIVGTILVIGLTLIMANIGA